MKIMGDFFRSIEWWKMISDQTVFEKWINGNVAARSSDGGWIVAYITDKAPFSIKLNAVTAGKEADAWWINPVTGDRTKTGTYKTSENRTFILPQGWQDAVLFIEKQH
jgi:hypothetical protein